MRKEQYKTISKMTSVDAPQVMHNESDTPVNLPLLIAQHNVATKETEDYIDKYNSMYFKVRYLEDKILDEFKESYPEDEPILVELSELLIYGRTLEANVFHGAEHTKRDKYSEADSILQEELQIYVFQEDNANIAWANNFKQKVEIQRIHQHLLERLRIFLTQCEEFLGQEHPLGPVDIAAWVESKQKDNIFLEQLLPPYYPPTTVHNLSGESSDDMIVVLSDEDEEAKLTRMLFNALPFPNEVWHDDDELTNRPPKKTTLVRFGKCHYFYFDRAASGCTLPGKGLPIGMERIHFAEEEICMKTKTKKKIVKPLLLSERMKIAELSDTNWLNEVQVNNASLRTSRAIGIGCRCKNDCSVKNRCGCSINGVPCLPLACQCTNVDCQNCEGRRSDAPNFGNKAAY